MSCFWDTLKKNLNIKSCTKDFIIDLKNKNSKTKLVLWNNNKLSNKQLNENYNHIKTLDENNYNNGYYCSTCEPILFLVCKIYKVNIHHRYLNNTMIYENKYKNTKCNTIFIHSNEGHMW